MRRTSVLIAATAFLFLLGSAGPGRAQKNGAPIEARRFQEALDRIAKGARAAGPLRRIEFSDNDLNVYIRHRLRASGEDVLRDARVKLYEGNRIEGWLEIDFGRANLPPLLRSRMNLYFLGAMIVQNGFVRFEFKDIFLEKERVPLMMLDMIVFVASQLGKTDAKSVGDWHALPAGLRDIRTADGRFTLFY